MRNVATSAEKLWVRTFKTGYKEVTLAQQPFNPAPCGYEDAEFTRTDLSQASVAAALEAAAKLCDEATAYREKQLTADGGDEATRDRWRGGKVQATLLADAIRALITPAQRTALQAAIDAAVAEARAEDAADSFAMLIADARAEAEKAMTKFPQPNYVISKFAEEAGEVVKAAIHCAENRETADNVRGEMKQAIAMLYRLWVEGDQVHGLKPLAQIGAKP